MINDSLKERVRQIKDKGIELIEIRIEPENCTVCACPVRGTGADVFETDDLYALLCVRCVGWGRATWRATRNGGT